MRTVRRLLTALVGLLASPAIASACSVCQERAMFEWAWWTAGLRFLALALIVEMVVVGLGARLFRIPVRGGAGWLLAGLVLGFGAVAAGLGFTGGFALVFAACLTRRLAASTWTMRESHPRLAAFRVALVAAIVVAGLVSVRPGSQSTEALVSIVEGRLHFAPIPAEPNPRSWAERELVQRPDASARILSRLDRYAPGAREYSRERQGIVRLLRAHALVGGEEAERQAVRERLGVTPDWGGAAFAANPAR